jgi:hypothetical protein
MKIKNHDDFPKLDHRTAPTFSADEGLVGEFSNGTSGENYSGINTASAAYRPRSHAGRAGVVSRVKTESSKSMAAETAQPGAGAYFDPVLLVITSTTISSFLTKTHLFGAGRSSL